MMEGKNIIAFSKEWEADWTSNHHILTVLARKNRVLWINSIGMRSPAIAQAKDWQRMIKKIFQGVKGIRKKKKNLYLLTPLVWPFEKPHFLRRWSFRLLTIQIRIFIWRMRMRPFQLWTFLPSAEYFVGRLGEEFSVYYCTDDWRNFPHIGGEKLASQERKLLKRVNCVFATSRYLKSQKERVNKHVYLITHGVGKIFQKKGKMEAPEDMKMIPRPILGFCGWLCDRVDKDLLFQLALSCPNCSLVLIGKETGDFWKLKTLPNVYFLGQKPYVQLPGYLSLFNVALIPYQMLPELMAATNPIKLKEYLALGIPVVTTDLTEAYQYHDACWIARTDEEFIRCVKEALEPSGKVRGKKGKEMVAKETWESKVEYLSQIIETEMKRQG